MFTTDISHSICTAETSAAGKSIFFHDPRGKVMTAYLVLTQEVLNLEKQCENIHLSAVDEPFAAEESRTNATRKKVAELPLDELYPLKITLSRCQR